MYRTNEDVTFVQDGQVVHVKAHRNVELSDAVAAKLGDKVTELPSMAGLVFPKGPPVIDVLRMDPANDGAHDKFSKK